MSTDLQLMTADELLALPRGEFRYELVKGELKKMSPAGHNHGRVIIRLTAPLAVHVRKYRLGTVYAAETGFKLTTNPDTVLAPDIAFIVKQQRTDGRRFYAELVFKESGPGDFVQAAGSLDITAAQQLMDDLWRCGVRPTEGKGSAGAMAATQRHLEDMRTLVFNGQPK